MGQILTSPKEVSTNYKKQNTANQFTPKYENKTAFTRRLNEYYMDSNFTTDKVKNSEYSKRTLNDEIYKYSINLLVNH